MNGAEIDACLDSMTILIDSREQPTDKSLQRYESFGVPYERCKLNFGDYTYNFRLPSGQMAYNTSSDVIPAAVIERKMNLEELSGCFCQSRDRFEREFERAISNGSKVYLLVEDANWEKLLHGRYKTNFNKKAFIGSILSWAIKYDIQIIFCQHEISGQLIKEILYRELKFRLLRGDYDER